MTKNDIIMRSSVSIGYTTYARSISCFYTPSIGSIFNLYHIETVNYSVCHASLLIVQLLHNKSICHSTVPEIYGGKQTESEGVA